MLAGLRSDVKCRDNNLLQNLNSLLESFPEGNGDDGDRTRNLRLAKPALSQLSYIPSVGVRGFEPRTSALSELRSNQLSYTPSRKPKRFRLEARNARVFSVEVQVDMASLFKFSDGNGVSCQSWGGER